MGWVSLLFCYGLLILGGASFGEVSSDNSKDLGSAQCPTNEEINSRLTEKIRLQSRTADLLRQFVSKEATLSVSPSSLFTVDLENVEAIERRRKELSDAVSQQSPRLSNELQLFQTCLMKDGSSTALLQKTIESGREVSLLRLRFLTLNQEQRSLLLSQFASAGSQQHAIAVQAFSKAVDEAESEQAKALEAKRRAELKAVEEKNADLRLLAEARAELEGVKSQLSSVEISITKSLEANAEERRGIANQLTQLTNLLIQSDAPPKLFIAYQEVAQIWRRVSGRTLNLFSNPDVLVPLPDIPSPPGDLLTRIGEVPDVAAYRASLEGAKKSRSDIVSLQKNHWEEEVNRNYLLLKQVGKARSEFLISLKELGETEPFSFNSDYVEDIKREFQLVPFRWRALLYSKMFVVRSAITSGLGGVFRLFRELLSLLALFLVPLLLVYFSRKLSKALDDHREKIVRSYQRTKRSLTAAIWIQRVNPYLEWLVALVALEIAGSLLKGTVFEEFKVILPYVSYYIYYRIFLKLLETTFTRVALRSGVSSAKARTKLQKTGRYVGTFFLAGVMALHATETSVGRALIYDLVQTLTFAFGYVIFSVAAYQWREEIAHTVPDYFSGNFGKRAADLTKGKYGIIFAFPVLLGSLLLAGLKLIKDELSEFDSVKRISAKLFRQKLESVASDRSQTQKRNPIPEDYAAHFSGGIEIDSPCLLTPERDVLSDVLKLINEWKADPEDENSLALYGEKGVGKSVLFERIARTVEDLEVVRIIIPGGMNSPEEVTKLFAESLGLDPDGDLSQIYKWDKQREKKTLVLIDDTHNLFLASVGGFDGYRKFLDLINMRLSNIFWCAAFNLHSWNYLKSVFRRSQFFRHTVMVPSLSDEDIEKLILTRHKLTDYGLSYDDIIYATQSARNYETADHAETQFFRLLWELSKGNPRSALSFWLSSLRPLGSKKFKVGLPEEPSSRNLQDLTMDTLLVYASIIRHENLSVAEMVRTTEVSEGLVRQARKVGVERKFLEPFKGGRYRVSPTWQYVLTSYLMNKNLLNVR